MNKIFTFVILSVVLSGCNMRKQEKREENIKEKKCESIVNLNCLDSTVVAQAFNLYDWKIVDDKAIFCLQDQQESFLVTYAYPSFELLYQFGRRGQGPEEYIVYNWCDALIPQNVSLYDIMKSSLYLYEVSDTCFIKTKKIALFKDEQGLCRPFTKACQINDSIFLLKEDSDIGTYLHLMNLNTREIFDSYECFLRNEVKSSYTPFDYCFYLVDDHIIIAYNYIDRLEFLKIDTENKLICEFVLGNKDDQSRIKDYMDLKCYYLCVRAYNSLFYCLRSTAGFSGGNIIEIYDTQGNFKQKIVLNREVNSINLDKDGNIVAYKEHQDNTIIYFFGKSENGD